MTNLTWMQMNDRTLAHLGMEFDDGVRTTMACGMIPVGDDGIMCEISTTVELRENGDVVFKSPDSAFWKLKSAQMYPERYIAAALAAEEADRWTPADDCRDGWPLTGNL